MAQPHFAVVRDPVYAAFERLYLDFHNPTGHTMTPAFVNAIRRILLAEVPACSVGLEQNYVAYNTSEFNLDLLRHRFALIPFALSTADLADFRPSEYLLRVCDPTDWSQPLRYRPEHRHASLALSLAVEVRPHLQLLRLRQPFRNHVVHFDYVQRQVILYATPQARAAEEDGKALHDHATWQECYEPVSEERHKTLLPYNFYLCRLQREQGLEWCAVPSYGTGLQFSAFQSCVQAGYDFLTTPGQRVDTSATTSHQFLRSRFAHYPQIIRLGIEYNGHYQLPLALALSLQVLGKKVSALRSAVIAFVSLPLGAAGDLNDENGAPLHVSDAVQDLTSLMDTSAIPYNLVIKLLGESHTLGNLLATYGLITLMEALAALSGAEDQKQLQQWFTESLTSYKLRHPLQPDIMVHFKTSEHLPANTVFSSRYAEHRLAVQLFLMTVDRIQGLVDETRTILEEIYPAIAEVTLPDTATLAATATTPRTEPGLEGMEEVDEVVG